MHTRTLDEQRRQIYETAEAIAPTWERRRAEIEAVAAPVREWMVRELRPQPGETVLELAAGAGDTGFDAATAIGDSGLLISSDLSPRMLDAARRRAHERGITNVDYRQIDAELIDLENDSVDGVLCRFGYMLMPDPASALVETRRVLRFGGRLALAVWGTPEQNPFFAMAAMSLAQRGHVPPPEPPPARGPFSLASHERLEGLLRDAGFARIRIEDVASRFVVADVDEYLAVVSDTAGPVALALRALDDRDRGDIRADVERPLERFATADGFQVPGLAVCAVAE